MLLLLVEAPTLSPRLGGGLCTSLSELASIGASPVAGIWRSWAKESYSWELHRRAKPGGPVPSLGTTTMWTVSGVSSYGLNKRTVTELLSRKFAYSWENGPWMVDTNHSLANPGWHISQVMLCWLQPQLRWFVCCLHVTVSNSRELISWGYRKYNAMMLEGFGAFFGARVAPISLSAPKLL